MPPGTVATNPYAPEQGTTNVMALMHRLFRGRYMVAIPVIMSAAIAGAVIGVVLGGPEYTSTSVVRVKSSLTRILYSTEQSETPGGIRFQHFVQTQAGLMTTERVLGQALQDSKLTPTTKELGVSGFRRLLNIQTKREAPELIYVNVTSSDPGIAASVVGATVDAYMDVYGESESLSRPELIRTLEELKRTKQGEIRAKENQIDSLAEEWGTSRLEPLQQSSMQTFTTLMDDLRNEEALLLELNSARDRELKRHEELADLGALSVDDIIEMMTGSMRINDLSRQRSEYEQMLRHFESAGVRPGHRRYRAVLSSIADVERKIREAAANSTRDQVALEAIEEQIDLAESRIERLITATEDAQKQAGKLSDAVGRIERLDSEITDLRAELEMAEDRYDAIILESKVEDFEEGARVTATRPTMPTEPTGDSRPKLAAAGFVGLGGAAFVLFAGVGFLDRRVRYSDDLELGSGLPRVMAVLPWWSASSRDDELLPFAVANTIHRVRAQLQWRLDQSEKGAVVITSGDSGEGKTSIVLSLGVSFARGGSRVLLVDLDLVGRSLTSQLALEKPDRLLHAIDSDHPARHAKPTTIDGVSLLGATRADETVGPRLSKTGLERFFGQLAEGYDVVLVDTGPLLGGIESSLACASSVGVVIVAGRGRPKMIVEHCVQAVRSLGGEVLGLVFNGALSTDFARSPNSQSQSARSRRADGTNGAELALRRWCPELGSPLAEIVASTLEHDDESQEPENAA